MSSNLPQIPNSNDVAIPRNLIVPGVHVLVDVVGFESSQIRAIVTRVERGYVWITTASIHDVGTKLTLDIEKVVGIECKLHGQVHRGYCGDCELDAVEAAAERENRIKLYGESLYHAAKDVAAVLEVYVRTDEAMAAVHELKRVMRLIDGAPQNAEVAL
jgi:hypothetical protein